VRGVENFVSPRASEKRNRKKINLLLKLIVRGRQWRGWSLLGGINKNPKTPPPPPPPNTSQKKKKKNQSTPPPNTRKQTQKENPPQNPPKAPQRNNKEEPHRRNKPKNNYTSSEKSALRPGIKGQYKKNASFFARISRNLCINHHGEVREGKQKNFLWTDGKVTAFSKGGEGE